MKSKFTIAIAITLAAIIAASTIDTSPAEAQWGAYSDSCGAYSGASCSQSYAAPSCGGYSASVAYTASGGVYGTPAIPPTYSAPQINYQPQYNTRSYSVFPPINVSLGYRPSYSRPSTVRYGSARQAGYPLRGSWWTGYTGWQHLASGEHAGKFDVNWLRSLSWEEGNALHSDDHENRVQWQYVVRPQQAARYANPVRYAQPVRSYSYAPPVRYAAPVRSYGSSYCPSGFCPN